MTLARLLLLDTETTGIAHSTDCPLEVAWGVYSIPDAALLSVRSCLVDAATYRADAAVPDSPEAEAVHGITRRMWIGGEAWAYVESMVRHEAMGCDAIAAHNASFDRGWFRDEAILGMPWIDTCDAVTWPWETRSRSLEALHLAALGYVTAGHRAIVDVLTLGRLLTAAAKVTDLRALLAPALRPRALYAVADTSFSAERNALAKAAGFRWTPEVREWRATIADEDAEKLAFTVRRVEEKEKREAAQ